MSIDNLNPRQKEFVRAITKELKPASQAYAQAYGGSPDDNSTQVKASQLLRNPKIAETLEEIEENMHVYASQAFENYVNLASDPKTPAAIKEKIYAKIMSLGGLTETKRLELTDNTERKEKDRTTLNELLQGMGYKKQITE